jgi:hypothetical protein
LFRLAWAVTLFYRVLIETKAKFGFEMRGLVLNEAWLSFFIKPANGLELPKIMQWLKQTFSLRFNVRTGRKAHLWGERYWSEILAGEPPEGAGGLGGGRGGGGQADTGGDGLQVILEQPPPGWIGLGSTFFAPIHVLLRVSAWLTAPLHGKKGVTARLDFPVQRWRAIADRWPWEKSARATREKAKKKRIWGRFRCAGAGKQG